MTDLSLFQTVDENGNTIEAVRSETKSFTDVEQCINHHCGSNDAIVDKFIAMALLSEQWDWYGEYKEWLQECDAVNTFNAGLVADEEGVVPDPRPLPVMPVRPAQTSLQEWKYFNYSLLRRPTYPSPAESIHLHMDDIDKLTALRSQVKLQYPKA